MKEVANCTLLTFGVEATGNELTSIGSVVHKEQVFQKRHKGFWPNEWNLIVILATEVLF